ncbi:MAG: sigma factor-like helix-turn-helix DNA-binding protein [Patescibacteria group bacterium]
MYNHRTIKQIYDGDPVQRQQLATFRSLAERETDELIQQERLWEPFDETLFASGIDTEVEVFNLILHEAIAKHLDTLPIRHKRALQWHVVDGQTFEEIAGRLGVSRARVDQIIEQASNALLKHTEVLQLKRFLEK